MMMLSSPVPSPNFIISFSPQHIEEMTEFWSEHPHIYHLDSSVTVLPYLLLCISIHQSISPLCPALLFSWMHCKVSCRLMMT